MLAQELELHQNLLAAKLKACAESSDLSQARQLHAQVTALEEKTSKNNFLANLVIDMYGKCGSIGDARAVFDALEQRNIFSWNIIISVYASNGQIQEARKIFDKVPQRNVVSWNTMLSAYTQAGHLCLAEELFEKMPRKNQVSWNAMISAYAEVGEVSKARHLFDHMPGKNVVSWTAMLAAYAERGHLHEARDLFVRAPQRNVVSWTTMILAYVKNGRLDDARAMFDQMPGKNVVTWTTMINAYARDGHKQQALQLFRRMDLDGIHPNAITLIAVANACQISPTRADAKLITTIVEETPHRSNLMVVTALIDLQGRSGSVADARALFDGARSRDLVLWTAIITAYAHNGVRDRAMEMFQEMELQGMEPNEITYINVLSGSATSGLVEDACLFFSSMVADYCIVPLIDHYIGMIHVLGRAGRLGQAMELVETMPFVADYVSWMALLSACEMHLDVERGIVAAERAAELRPGTSSPYVVLANVYAKTKDVKVARALERRSKKL